MNDTKHPAGHILQAYFDCELEASAAAEVKAHCAQCPVCEAEVADLDRVGRMLAGAPVPELSRRVWPHVRPARETKSRLQPAFGIAACAAGIVLGVLLGPIQFDADESGTKVAWSETVTIWNSGASTSLLSVYQTAQE